MVGLIGVWAKLGKKKGFKNKINKKSDWDSFLTWDSVDSLSGGTPLKRKVFQEFFLRLGFGPLGPKPNLK